METDEKLMALKKAYADVIFNISKEAAARVMASEKRAARYQHELKLAKEEALRMLLRIKQMMDSQINMAEAASLTQQKKIEEVEAQLQEAEDIVRDLREELREVHAELERVKRENFQPANESVHFRPMEIPVKNGSYLCQSSTLLPALLREESAVASQVTKPHQSLRNGCNKCHNKVGCVCGLYSGNGELPSIILRGKEQGLYRNGCTQRILACERNQLCFSGKADEVQDKKIETGLEDDNTTCKSLPSDQSLSTKFFGSASCIQKRRRTVRWGKPMTPLTEKPILSELPVRNANPSEIVTEFLENEAEPQIQLENTKFSKEAKHFKGDAENVETHEELVGDMTHIAVETGHTKSPSFLDHNEDMVLTNPGMDSPSKGRDFKYTFQRKRKREAVTSPDGSLVRENESGDSPNSDKKLEPSRDSRQLALVARQLISLSEKKW